MNWDELTKQIVSAVGLIGAAVTGGLWIRRNRAHTNLEEVGSSATQEMIKALRMDADQARQSVAQYREQAEIAEAKRRRLEHDLSERDMHIWALERKLAKFEKTKPGDLDAMRGG